MVVIATSESQTFTLKKYLGREGEGVFRVMHEQEARELRYGQRVWFRTTHGDARLIKVNGRVRMWVRDQERLEIPWKYGLYEYGTLGEGDIRDGRLLVEVK